MTLYDQSIAVYRTRIDTMIGMLTKAEAHAKGDALLESRLADDMHPLATQVRFVTNLPGEALPRLMGREFTSRDDNETTIAGAKAALVETTALLDGITADALVAPDDTVVLSIPNGMEFTMKAEEYVRDWSLPNFYFHLTTAYAILRMEGVELGKADFVPHMMKYMTKGPG
ncbi:DUF1993 domain-containing protein [Erythrobacter sp. Alg231-14]|uniref:DUF1993 domain-containing protein n=1 Tax=Erythrobacter sp. Alg231-14 TaxID=1922225 RepID=UPI00307B898D